MRPVGQTGTKKPDLVLFPLLRRIRTSRRRTSSRWSVLGRIRSVFSTGAQCGQDVLLPSPGPRSAPDGRYVWWWWCFCHSSCLMSKDVFLAPPFSQQSQWVQSPLPLLTAPLSWCPTSALTSTWLWRRTAGCRNGSKSWRKNATFCAVSWTDSSSA